MKIPRKCHYHEAHPSRGTKRRRDEEQIRTTQAPHIKPQTHKQRRTATEEPPWNGGTVSSKTVGWRGEGSAYTIFYSRETSPLNVM